MNANTLPAKPQTLNGIDIDALKGLVKTVAADPAKGLTHWRVMTTWQGQTHSRSQVDGFDFGGEHIARPFSIDIDEPFQLGGLNRFPNPQEHLIAALNACMTVTYVSQCSIRGISIERLEIETSGDIDLRGCLGLDEAVTRGYDALTYTVRIKGNATREQFEEVHAAVKTTSPNFHNIARAIELKSTLIVD